VEALALSLNNVPSPISSKYYVSQSEFINELNTICDALYTDYISKNINKSRSDLYLYISLFEEEINIAAILRYGSYLIRYLVTKCNIKTDYILSSFKELMFCIDQSIGIINFDKESIHALLLRVLKVLDHDDLFTLIPETTKTVESAKEFICTHYHEQISLALVADNLKVTPSYLSDLFHKCMGEPYTKFLTRVRMEQALLLLKSNPNEKIYKIADKTGFVSAKHFNSVFKKYYGFTPTEYINKNML
jgi:AraC-like DNA-binding protein